MWQCYHEVVTIFETCQFSLVLLQRHLQLTGNLQTTRTAQTARNSNVGQGLKRKHANVTAWRCFHATFWLTKALAARNATLMMSALQGPTPCARWSAATVVIKGPYVP
jgi:hypothetical protein